MSVAPDYAKSVEFLRQWRPEGPWVLTAISLDRKTVPTRTFTKDEEAELLAWLGEHGRELNVYFAVNPLLRAMDKKAERQDVAELAWLHVDIDPRAGEEVSAEQVRALALLRNPPAGIPAPTCIVFSGGGYQGFWRLSDPMRIDGQVAAYEEAARYNLQLEILFGADHCHNVDRIMRLPGTVNRPTEKKRRKGRTEALSALVDWGGASYELKQFIAAPLVQGAGDVGGGGGPKVEVSGNVQRFDSVDDLPDAVSQSCRVAIVQGLDPDNPKKMPSRSEWLFWVCCELVRAGCTDDQIFAVITDPDFLISSSVLELGTSRAEKYALRQIRRAKEEAIDPWLRRLNEKHAVVGDIGGKCRIISEVATKIGDTKRSRISYQSFNDFKNRYAHRRIDYMDDGKPASVPVAQWWISHAQRRDYESVVFSPGGEVEGAYNLWKGFAFEARPGSCKLFLDHVMEIICQRDETLFSYVMGWMATAVQHPGYPGQTAIVLRGRQGTGKGILARTFGNLFGRHFLHIANSKHLVGDFNSHLRDCVVLFADEAFYAGDRKHEAMLKMLVTEEMITIEGKGVDAEPCSNFVHLLMASNSQWVVPAGFDERRFLVLDVSTEHMQDSAYFSAIMTELRSGGYEALLHHLLTYDLSQYEVRALPKTAALQEQKILSFNPEEEWWFGKLQKGEVFEGEGWPQWVFSTRLGHDYTTYGKMWHTSSQSSSTRLGRFMQAVVPSGFESKGRVNGNHQVILEDGTIRSVDRPRIYLLPSLENCRLQWDRQFGGPYIWTELKDLGTPPVPADLPF